jgi:hypothetical protein
MAKHPSARRRTNAPASTAREIVLRSPDEPLRPVPELPPRNLSPAKGEPAEEVEWHDRAKIAWTELWQFPLVYQAPEVDHHLLFIYIALIDDFWRKLEHGRPVTEQANQIRAFSEQWGVGEKSRRHLQITIQEAEEAIERGMTQQRKRVESQVLEDPKPTAELYTPTWNDDDEDSDLVADAEVVE